MITWSDINGVKNKTLKNNVCKKELLMMKILFLSECQTLMINGKMSPSILMPDGKLNWNISVFSVKRECLKMNN